MEPERQRKRGRKRERPEGTAFMDVARDAFVRYLALDKWREIEDMRATLGFDRERAVREAGQFVGRGPYQALWVRRWEEQVLPQAAEADPGRLYAAIEGAVAAALGDEERERKLRGDRPVDEDPEYRAFLDAALGKLSRAAAGELGLF